MAEITDPDLIAQLELPQSEINKPAAGSKTISVPEGARKELEAQVSAYGALERATKAFDNNYSGPGSGIESMAQGVYSPVGTPGQRDWWADFKLTDTMVRNAFFGASLTPSEQAAYAETTITPNMDPKEIKRNLNRRRELALERLRRNANFARANKYEPAAIDALLGEYAPVIYGDSPPTDHGADDAPPKLSSDQFRQELERLISTGDEAAVNAFLNQQNQSVDDPAALKAALKVRRARVIPGQNTPAPPKPEGPGFGEQLWDSTVNTVAGVGQGLAALPDTAARAVGYGLGEVADVIPGVPDWVGSKLRNPTTIGGEIEKVAPTPQDWTGWGVRKASEFAGGVAGFPARANSALANLVVGEVPKRTTGNALNAITNKELIKEAAELGIDVTMPVVGGPATRTINALTAQTVGGARPVVAGARRMVDQGGRALANIAGREGKALTAEAAGETATAGALKYRDTSRSEIGKIYDQAAKIAGEVRVIPERAVAALDRHLNEFAETPMAEDAAAYLQKLRTELVEKYPDGVTVQGIRGMRTALRDRFYKDGLRGSDIERRVNEIVDEVSDDLTSSLVQAGKGEAANLFRQADKAWKIRAETLDDIIMPIIGKKGDKSGEGVAKALDAATRGNGKRLDRFLRALPKEEAGDVRATIIGNMGKSKEADFSFNTFLNSWDQVGDTARKALFAEGDRAAMDKLARISSRVKDAAKYANHPNTGGVIVNAATLSVGYANPVAGLAAVAGSYSLGKVLASAGGARILAQLVEARTPAATKEAVGKLTGLAVRNPAAANDIMEVQAALTRSFQSPATTAAAEEQE